MSKENCVSIGDVVCLSIDSPNMTVVGVFADGSCECGYFTHLGYVNGRDYWGDYQTVVIDMRALKVVS